MFFETIRIQDNKIFHLEYHQERFEKTIYENYGYKTKEKLHSFITPPSNKLLKCKICYGEKITKVTYDIYTPKIISSLKIVESDISYKYKYENRNNIAKLIDKQYDEILIVKNGYLKDTSIANIALKIDGIWNTPSSPLFYGTTRERLLYEGKIIKRNLKTEDFKKAQEMSFLNAMINFCKVSLAKIDIINS